jgi:hypothetical protein
MSARAGIAMLVAALAAVPPSQASAAPAASEAAPLAASQPPSQADCPAVANVDLRWLRRELDRLARRDGAAASSTRLGDVVVPADAARRPPADAAFVIRVRVPPGGLYPQDERSVVWREADGSWWGWRDVDGGQPASPPPPPAPGSPEAATWDSSLTYDPYPPYEGRLDAGQSALMEAAFADPCRGLEPSFTPARYRLLRAEDGKRWRDCAWRPDEAAYFAEITEAGRPARQVSLRCLSGSLNHALVTWAAHVQLPRTASRPVGHSDARP